MLDCVIVIYLYTIIYYTYPTFLSPYQLRFGRWEPSFYSFRRFLGTSNGTLDFLNFVICNVLMLLPCKVYRHSGHPCCPPIYVGCAIVFYLSTIISHDISYFLSPIIYDSVDGNTPFGGSLGPQMGLLNFLNLGLNLNETKMQYAKCPLAPPNFYQ